MILQNCLLNKENLMTDIHNEMNEKRDFIGIEWITLRAYIDEVDFSEKYKDQLEIDPVKIYLRKDEEYLHIRFNMNAISIPYVLPGVEFDGEDYFDEMMTDTLGDLGVYLLEGIYSLDVMNVTLVKKTYLKYNYQDYRHLLNVLNAPGFLKSYLEENNTIRFENDECRIEFSSSNLERELGPENNSPINHDIETGYEEDALLIWIEIKDREILNNLFGDISVGFFEFDESSINAIFEYFLEEFLPSIEEYDVDYSVSVFLEANLNLIKTYYYPAFNEHLERAKKLVNIVDDVTPYAMEGKYEGSVISAFIEMIEGFQEVIRIPKSYGLEDYQNKQKLGDWMLDDRLEKLKELKNKLINPAEEIGLLN